ncbi:MAG: sulfotransferase [Pseudomonadota bacterium]
MTGFVINLGLPKSGTTTLSRALRRSGIKVADWRVRPAQTDNEAQHNQLVGELIYKGYFETGDPLAEFGAFGAITEMSAIVPGHNFWPQTDWGVLSAIMDRHPDARFLLSARDPAKTADSMMRWNTLGKRRLPRQYVPGLPFGYGKTASEIQRWIEGHYAFCRRVFAGTDKLLEFSVADPDASAQISAFLGRDMPWWGRANGNAVESDAADPVTQEA